MLVAFCPSGRRHFAWECSQSSVGILRLRDKPKRDLARDTNRDTFELQHWESSYFGASPKPRQIPSSYTKISKGIFFCFFYFWLEAINTYNLPSLEFKPGLSEPRPSHHRLLPAWEVGFFFFFGILFQCFFFFLFPNCCESSPRRLSIVHEARSGLRLQI